jgi:parvulin-like peptidyl-prolyl isomerase
MQHWGDKLPFSYYFEELNANKLGLQLGSKFTDALKNQDTNKWIGPIPSGFGYHLVYITNKVAPQLPEYEMVKKEVLRNYEYDNQKETNELIYKELKKKYDIEFHINSEDFDPKYVEYLENEFNK